MLVNFTPEPVKDSASEEKLKSEFCIFSHFKATKITKTLTNQKLFPNSKCNLTTSFDLLLLCFSTCDVKFQYFDTFRN